MPFGDFKFHGAFTSKAKAQAKEKSVKGAFIEEKKIRGVVRYIVMTKKGGR